jgi:hypothetical protein
MSRLHSPTCPPISKALSPSPGSLNSGLDKFRHGPTPFEPEVIAGHGGSLPLCAGAHGLEVGENGMGGWGVITFAVLIRYGRRGGDIGVRRLGRLRRSKGKSYSMATSRRGRPRLRW